MKPSIPDVYLCNVTYYTCIYKFTDLVLYIQPSSIVKLKNFNFTMLIHRNYTSSMIIKILNLNIDKSYCNPSNFNILRSFSIVKLFLRSNLLRKFDSKKGFTGIAMSVVHIDIQDINNTEMSDIVKSNISLLSNELRCAISADYYRFKAEIFDLNFTTEPETVERKVEQDLMNKLIDVHMCNTKSLHSYTTGIYERLNILEKIYKLKLRVLICDNDMKVAKSFLISEILQIPMTKQGTPKKFGTISIIRKALFWYKSKK